ncbi:hypothetical protein RN001_004758 [Aquatica leii]|uniref:Major facilitator superfamily (MFS) profile domain-containing protein n=1 Tax=Aquatica leii TaxID=1421715 RepID=A0AAN7PBT5_9COLE|nr:hypothetical protein RN001_004758 [Aquatica leii]
MEQTRDYTTNQLQSNNATQIPQEIQVDEDHMNVSDAITLAGFGKFNLFLVFVGGGCLMCIIIESMGAMFVIPAADCDFKLTVSLKGFILAASFLGIALTSHFWGFLADMYGRRIIILISMSLTFVVSVVSAFSINGWTFLVLKFLSGLFLSGTCSVLFTYVGELHSDFYRPIVMSWVVMFVAFGNTIMPGLAWLILPLEFSIKIPVINVLFKSWRLLALLYTVLTLLFTILIFYREEEARLVLTKIYTCNRGRLCNQLIVKKLILNEDFMRSIKSARFLSLMWSQTVQLYQMPYLIKTLLVDALQFGIFMASTGFYMWYPEIMNNISKFEIQNPDKKGTICRALKYHFDNNGVSTNDTLNSCSNTIRSDVFTVNLILGAFLVSLYFSIGCLVGYLGKRKCLLLLFLISILSSIPAQYLSGSTSIKVSMALALASYTSIGLINAVTVDLYPTQVRGMGVAMSLMFGRFGAVMGVHISGRLFYYMCTFSYIIYAVFHIVLITIVHFLTTKLEVSKHKNIV